MPLRELSAHFKKMRVKPGKKIDLTDFETSYSGKSLDKAQANEMLEAGRKQLAEMQDKLFVHNQYSVLIIFQAMDAAGKDSAIKHILSGLNVAGVSVHSFKTPTKQELDHDYFWRHNLALPARGEIAIHNRSHYENVLVTRVHPEYILNEQLPDVNSVKDVNKKFWERRLKQIIRFERNLVQNGTVILKFFLHVSRDEQKKRFLERINDATKNWKFSTGDLKERALWDQYQSAYEDAISATSKKSAPWFIIPADNKWYARLAIASIIHEQFETLKLSYPEASEALKEELKAAKELLENEPLISAPKKKQSVEKKQSATDRRR